MSYLVIILSEDFTLPPDALFGALRRDWPDATAEMPSPHRPIGAVIWEHRAGADCLEGKADAAGNCLYLDGGLEAALRFAIWYRGLVPAAHRVVLCDDCYSFDVDLSPGMTAGDIDRAIAAFQASGG